MDTLDRKVLASNYQGEDDLDREALNWTEDYFLVNPNLLNSDFISISISKKMTQFIVR